MQTISNDFPVEPKRINIKTGSKADVAIKKAIAKKNDFIKAVQNGKGAEYAKQNPNRFAKAI